MSKEIIKSYLRWKPSFEIGDNPIIEYHDKTETAGYLPLSVRLKQLEQQGYIAQFRREEFDSDEISELWTRKEFEILPSDDLEDIDQKLKLRSAYLRDILQKHHNSLAEETVQSEIVDKDKVEENEEK